MAGSAGTGYTETTGTTTDDGTIVFVCTYDDVTHELLFCDVYFYPRNSMQAPEERGRTNATIDDYVNNLASGNDLAVPQRAAGAPSDLGTTVDDRKGDKDRHGQDGRASKGKKGKKGGKGRKK